jgi:phosphoenolpyruvate-protein kinase (PTS system EI component)
MMGTQQKILKLLGKTHARLIEAYLLILEDPLISKDVVKNITTNRVNAEYALSEAVAGAVKTLEVRHRRIFPRTPPRRVGRGTENFASPVGP